MSLVNGFDASQVDPATDFTPIPAAEYKVILKQSEEKATQKGDGKQLKLVFEVIEGEYKKRLLFDNLVLKHPNETTVKIARGKLSSLCRAVNVLKPNDSVQLHNIPLMVKVGQEKRTDNGEMKNVIKAYLPLVRGVAQVRPDTQQIAPADDAGTRQVPKNDKAPWKK